MRNQGGKVLRADTQRKLAALLDRGRNAVSGWECGRTLPNVPRLMRMAKILGTLAESLYTDFYVTFPKEDEAGNPAKR